MAVQHFLIPGTVINVAGTDAAEGDQRPPSACSPALWDAVGERPWSWLRQQHGSRVLAVSSAGDHAGDEGDGLVTASPHSLLVAFGADCALIALASPEGHAGVVHAGWRGLLAGVVGEGVQAMRSLGASRVLAWRSACIHAECYEFEGCELDIASEHLGPTVRAETTDGRPAFDLPAAVRVSLERAGAVLVGEHPSCTACADGWFSWRARRETSRMALAVWAGVAGEESRPFRVGSGAVAS
jgi:polyphenol oxidase